MTAPIFVRELTTDEQAALRTALRSSDAFSARRAHILLASSEGMRPAQIARTWNCTPQGVRNAIHDFNSNALAATTMRSRRPKTTKPLFDQIKAQQLCDILHRSPRDEGFVTSLWSLARLAIVAQRQGLTTQVVSIETIRQALLRVGIKWRKARKHITSPDADYERKKSGGIA